MRASRACGSSTNPPPSILPQCPPAALPVALLEQHGGQHAPLRERRELCQSPVVKLQASTDDRLASQQTLEIGDGLSEPRSQGCGRRPFEKLVSLAHLSGRRCFGSSIGNGLCTMREDDTVRSTIVVASSLIVNSTGLPRLTGPVISTGGPPAQGRRDNRLEKRSSGPHGWPARLSSFSRSEPSSHPPFCTSVRPENKAPPKGKFLLGRPP